MPKIRTLKAGYFQDTKLAEIDIKGRYLFAGILCSMCDDDGIFQANPKLIKGLILPFEDEISLKHVTKWLNQLKDLEIILPFSHNSTEYFQVANWYKHQRVPPEKYYPSSVPESSRPVAPKQPQGNRKATAQVLGIGDKEQGIGNNEKEQEKETDNTSACADFSQLSQPPTESILSVSNSEKASLHLSEKKTQKRVNSVRQEMPVSVEQVIEFAREKLPAANTCQCNDFFDTMTVKGWVVSGKPVKDWQATFRVWLNKGWLKPNYGESTAIRGERPLTEYQQRMNDKAKMLAAPNHEGQECPEIPF